MPELPSNAGYADEADALAIQYERLNFEDTHRDLIPLLPAPGLAVDIGAGTGRDIGWLVAQGWQGVAVEPTAELRAHAERLHPSPAITWIDDGLPALTALADYRGRAGLVLLTAVWMHLTREERIAAMPGIASLLARGGILSITVRHGPIPAGRRMFEIPSEEVIADAESAGLTTIFRNEHRADGQGRPGVHWSRVVFRCGSGLK